MAANSKSSKPKGTKKPAQKKGGLKSATKKTSPKNTAKPGAAKAQHKPVPADKKTSEAGLAFDKKIDRMAQISSPSQNTGKKVLKALIGILVVIAAAVLVYLFYPKAKTSVVKEDTASKPAPPQNVKLPEPPKETVKPASGDETIYVVKHKDQLTEISKKYYGNFIGWKLIYAANKDKIKNPHLIFPGQQLVIPKKEQ